MKVATWNVNGVRAREKELLEFLAKEKPDVFCMQETKATTDQLPPDLYGLTATPDYHAFWHGKAGYSGVSMHLRRATFASPKSSHPDFDMEARILEVTCDNTVFITMYVPNGGKDYKQKIEFLKQLGEYPKRFPGKSIVLLGDLNVARTAMDVTPKQRQEHRIGQHPEERTLFEVMLSAGLTDVVRTLAPTDETIFTWWPYWSNSRKRNVGWRIDYVLATSDLASRALSFKIHRDFGTSDHAPLVVDFS